MGAPKRLRKKYESPMILWDKDRIEEEHALKEKYGLKTLKEIWRAKSELRRIRRNARDILSGKMDERIGKELIGRLAKYDIVKGYASVDDLLVINVESLLERRLQTIVLKRGLARSIRQARQLITHGFIAINGRKVTIPGYLVSADEENGIGYYKKIEIEPLADVNKIG